MAGVTGGVEEFLALEAVAALESEVLAGLVGGGGDGLGDADDFEGQRFQIGPEVEQLLSGEFVLVAHVVDHAGQRRLVDGGVGVGRLWILAPPGFAVVGIPERVSGADQAIGALGLIEIGVTVGAGQAVVAD